MDALTALDRAVYLLDRELAPSTKVRAFQRARDVVAELEPNELAALVESGDLYDLPGIGKSTGSVIESAVRGGPHDYLDALDERSRVELGDGAELRAALRGDCHAHTTWSDGGASVTQMAAAAQALGHEYLVITDHSARLTVAHGLNAERLRTQLDEIAEVNRELAPFRVLTGMEVDIFGDGSLDLDDELLNELDVVVASVHSDFRMPRDEMTRRLVMAIASPHVDIVGHITNRKVVGRGRPGSDFDPEIVFAACARFDTAIEINCRPERQDPPDELLELAVEWDCKIAINTDAHAPGQLEWQAYGCDRGTRLGVAADAVVNALPADELLAWAAAHPQN
jgi:putative hydrolase